MNYTKKLRNLLAGILMSGISAVPLMAEPGFNPPSVNPNTLMFAGYGIYQEKFPLPVVVLGYDTNNDEQEDIRMIYLAQPFTESTAITELIEYLIDYNKNGEYSTSERHKNPKFEKLLKVIFPENLED